MATKEYFPGIGKIKFEGVESKNPMAFRYYDAEKVVMGKKMKDWLKFSMAWWHNGCPRPAATAHQKSQLIQIKRIVAFNLIRRLKKCF